MAEAFGPSTLFACLTACGLISYLAGFFRLSIAGGQDFVWTAPLSPFCKLEDSALALSASYIFICYPVSFLPPVGNNIFEATIPSSVTFIMSQFAMPCLGDQLHYRLKKVHIEAEIIIDAIQRL